MLRLKELHRERGYTQIKTQPLTGIAQSDLTTMKDDPELIPDET